MDWNWLRRVFFWRQRKATQVNSAQIENNFLVLNIFAKADTQFASYELLQALLAAGMQFGDMNIFHYYDPEAQPKKKPIFSLASATEPGDFNLQKIGEFSCPGLTLFMNLNKVPDPAASFQIMLSVAEELAEELGGDLCVAPGIPWGPDKELEYQRKISLVR